MKSMTTGSRRKIALVAFAICAVFVTLIVHDVHSYVDGGILWNPWFDQVFPFLFASRNRDGLMFDCSLNDLPASFALTPIQRGNYYFQIRIPGRLEDFAEQPFDIHVSCSFETGNGSESFVFDSDKELSSFWTWCRSPSSGSVLDLGHFNVPRDLALGEGYVGSILINGRGCADFMKSHMDARLQLRQMNLK